MNARQALRQETRAAHDAVDQAFSGFDLGTIDGYRDFLAAQAAAFLPVEAALDGAGAEAVIPDWPLRRRSDLIRADLVELGVPVPDDPPAVELSGDFAVLGAVYVLEGSRLGGSLLRRHVPSGAPMRFLGGDDHGPRWRELIRLLDDRLTRPQDLEIAVTSARSIFDRFLTAARERLQP